MLTLIFVVAAIIAIVVHYLLVERARERREVPDTRVPAAGRLARWLGSEGVYLQPAFTCSRVAGDGDLLVGVHPLLLDMAGDEARVDVAVSGRRVRRGDPLLRIRMGGREVSLPSPASGAIEEVRSSSRNGTPGDAASVDDVWACRLRPSDLRRDAGGWLDGGDARRWTDERYREIREYVMRVGAGGEVGVALADGGDIPRGLLRSFSDEQWEAFRERFLTFA